MSHPGPRDDSVWLFHGFLRLKCVQNETECPVPKPVFPPGIAVSGNMVTFLLIVRSRNLGVFLGCCLSPPLPTFSPSHCCAFSRSSSACMQFSPLHSNSCLLPSWTWIIVTTPSCGSRQEPSQCTPHYGQNDASNMQTQSRLNLLTSIEGSPCPCPCCGTPLFSVSSLASRAQIYHGGLLTAHGHGAYSCSLPPPVSPTAKISLCP